jgi:hypothetical protein
MAPQILGSIPASGGVELLPPYQFPGEPRGRRDRENSDLVRNTPIPAGLSKITLRSRWTIGVLLDQQPIFWLGPEDDGRFDFSAIGVQASVHASKDGNPVNLVLHLGLRERPGEHAKRLRVRHPLELQEGMELDLLLEYDTATGRATLTANGSSVSGDASSNGQPEVLYVGMSREVDFPGPKTERAHWGPLYGWKTTGFVLEGAGRGPPPPAGPPPPQDESLLRRALQRIQAMAEEALGEQD